MRFLSFIMFSALIAGFIALPVNAQSTGSIFGVVQDSLGAVVVGANVTAVSSDNKEKSTITNQKGEFNIAGLAPGKYTVKVTAPKFAAYENTEVEVTAGQKQELVVPLTVEGVQEQVDVETDTGVSTDPDSSAGATVLKGKDLEALPDDPDELEQALQALAGPSAGPNGGQIYIDGFTGGRLPPKESIREIRINQNPFSAEFDRLGFGRIEILTRPGSDKLRGGAFFNFADARLNTKNPFSDNKAPGQMKVFGGNVSGPIQKGKSSFFFDINNRNVDSNALINAFVLDENLEVVPFNQEVQVPTRRFSFSPRFDFQIGKSNTLQFRYSFNNNSAENQGVGGLSLPSRGYETAQTEHEFRVTETMIINPTTINETRFEYSFNDRSQTGDNSIPGISVGAGFVGGGATIGESFNKRHTWELQNFTTTVFGKNAQHSFKFGGRVRGVSYLDRSENGFGGSFSFVNIDTYRGAILDTAIPQQYNVTMGDPEEKVTQYDYNLFATDDWRINPGLTLSLGLRYENQTNVSDNLNFAPRVAFAWSPGATGARAPKTVIRGGFGVFYERINDNLTLQTQRFDGNSQLNLIVSSTDPDPVRRAIAIGLLSQPTFTNTGVTNVPTADQILALLPQSNTIRTMQDDIKVPYYYQFAISVERQLPGRTTISASYINSKNFNVLRTRNVNAPICPLQVNCLNEPRPIPSMGNIYEYEATGSATQNQIIVNFRSNFNPKVSFFGNYRLGFANGDTDGTGSFPAYSYDLASEYGRSSSDVRHFFVIGGNVNLPWGISLNPFVTASTGRPFNIIRGFDTNGDSLVTERPTFAELGARCNALGLTTSFCDVSGQDPTAIIPRNFGQASGFFSVNMRFSKNFGFGGGKEVAAAGNQGGRGEQRTVIAGGPGGPGGGRGPGGGGGGPMMMMMGGGGDGRKPYNLNFSVDVQNLFNTINYAAPIGNLASDRFGQVISTQSGFGGFGGGGFGGVPGNRRITIQTRFSW